MTLSDVEIQRASPITDRTKQGYIKAFETAHKRSIAKRTTDWDEPAMVTVTEIVRDFTQRQDLAQSTYNMVRSAMIWIIRSGYVSATPDTREALQILMEMKSTTGPKLSAKRAKTISITDLHKLLDELYIQSEGSIWAKRAALWINAGLACGARPIEWLDVAWSDDTQSVLQIRTAKVKVSAPAYSRSKTAENNDHLDEDVSLENPRKWLISDTSPYRDVPITTDHERGFVASHMSNIAEAAPYTLHITQREEQFKNYYDGCRLAINRACKRIWKGEKLYSLYTLRGQYSANMRAHVGSEETSRLLGHTRADSPSASYYGKANQAHQRSGRGGDRPAQVKQLLETGEQQTPVE